MSAAEEQFDAVGLAIMWDRLISITDEILSALVRSSFSSIVRESYDLSVILLDAEGNSLAQGSYSVPSFTGTAPLTLRHMLQKFPPETLRPGDVLATNDAWMGTGHLFDINVMQPVFRGGRIVGYTLSVTHLPDIGGTGFGASATEIYHEGLRLPICKLVREGDVDQLVLDVVRANVRVPEQVFGDLMANVSCNEVGGRQVLEFMDEYGLDDLMPLSRAVRGQAEQAMREKIVEMPDGSYENRIEIEGIDGPIPLACRVGIAGDGLEIDFSGTGAAVDRGMNVPFCYTRAMALYAIKCLTVPGIPNNEGSVVPIRLSAPEGCILNAQHPSPTGGRHIVGHFVPSLVFGALAEVAPEQVQADCGMMNLVTFQGTHRNGRGLSTIYFASGGFGALDRRDGAETTPGPSNMVVAPVEVWESLTSMTVERKRLLPDSGGPGAARGGLGQETTLRNDTGHPLTVFCMANRTDFPPLGFLGGKPGWPRQNQINGEAVHPKGTFVLEPGDTITMLEAGGGGFGDPGERPREKLLADVRSGLVSVDAALTDYGVEVEGAVADTAA